MVGKYKNLIAVLAVIAVVGIGISAFLFYQYTTSQKELANIKKAAASQKNNPEGVAKIVAEVGKIMKLPEGELPTMATISDVSKLKEQAFFRNSKNGDVLLVYNKAGKAILYSPADKKIVEVAPISGVYNPTVSPSPFQPKVLLRNGTMTSTLPAKVEGEIKKVFPTLIVTGKENAARDTYDKTVIVVLNQAAKETAQNLIKTLSATSGDLPSAEKKPTDVDILIILGKDQI